jgi:creatinine amidohydrolase/Fe(II)-dependent formamide hydrolase-like protein
MNYPGTISLETSTFIALLTEIARSYKAHGFADIILTGDSGGNQAGMKTVADTLNARWANETARVHYLTRIPQQRSPIGSPHVLPTRA